MSWAKWSAGGVVAALLLTQTAVNAHADVIPFDSVECHVAAEGTGQPQPSWHLDRLDLDTAWHIATGEGVAVAVIDTGVATMGSLYLQQDDPGRFITYDGLDGRKSDGDQQVDEFDCLHGTRVTALLAAGRAEGGGALDGRVEFSGVAPDVTVVTYRTLMQSESEEDSEPQALQPTTDAVLDAIQREVDVINLSQVVPSGVEGFEAFQAAVAQAIDAGIVVVAAAGNSGQLGGGTAYPAAFEGVISVGASNRNDAGSTVTEFGAKIDVGAPGEGLTSLDPSRWDSVRGMESQVYSESISGTSYAAPIVSGIVALMIEKQRRDGLPPLTPAEVKQRLIETADPPAATVPDPRLGAGIVNPVRVLSGEIPQLAPNDQADNSVPPLSYPPREERSMVPATVGIIMGVGALVLTTLGIVAAVTIPAVRKNSGRQSK